MLTFGEKKLIDKEVYDNNALIIKNASELVFHAGLLPVEIINLSINDVEKNGSIVNQIEPVNCDYPAAFKKLPILLSQNAQNLLVDHITFIKTLKNYSAENFPLFPHILLDPRYELDNSRYNIINLWDSLKHHSPYINFERHREAVILSFCWNKFNNGVSEDELLREAHSFSRYANLNVTKKLVKLGISRDANVYENNYKNAVKASGILCRHHTRPDRLSVYLSEFENSLTILDEKDQKSILDKTNNDLKKDAKSLTFKNNTLSYANITSHRLSPKSIPNRSKRRV